MQRKPPSCHPEKPYYSKGMCSTCYEAARRLAQPERREYMREYLKRYKAEQPEKIAEHYQRRRADPEKRARDAITKKNAAYKAKYGISLNGFRELLKAQGNSCALCMKSLDERKANVDHCHTTLVIRGILCSACNTGLGQLGDDEKSILRALEYVRRSALISAD